MALLLHLVIPVPRKKQNSAHGIHKCHNKEILSVVFCFPLFFYHKNGIFFFSSDVKKHSVSYSLSFFFWEGVFLFLENWTVSQET